jgi:septal ring factor EnvC (AmiA/AmiB activator)
LKQFDDEEALEKQRQEMLDNMERYEKMMPGWSAQVSEIVSDPEKWKQAMANAKAQLMQLRESRRQQRSGVNPADTGLKNDSVDDINDEEEN